MAEKQRRDNLNSNIATMSALVPIVAASSRRMDKISILRLAAAFLRTQYTLGSGLTNFLPRQFNEFDLEQYFVDCLVGNGGFFLIVTATGKIIYVSRQVEQHLGHAQNELLGQSLYNFVYAKDHEKLTKNLTPEGMHPTRVPSGTNVTHELTNDSSNSSEDSTSHKAERIKFFREERRSFEIRMSQRTVSRRENTQYECLHISGILRLAEACKNTETNTSRGRREMASTSNDIVFAGIANLPKIRPFTELSIIDANKDEYVTRHLVDGRIIYCDHRVSVVAGYLSEEVSGLSAFAFMHKDDFRWTIIGLRQMYDRAETYGSSCYRLISKTGEFIYLRTHGYLEYDKRSKTVESFVCINTLISEEEGVKSIREMKERFSATVSGCTRAMIKDSDNLSLDVNTNSQQSDSKYNLEEPSQLEDAITHLISDLSSPAISEEALTSSPIPNSQFVKAAIFSQHLPPAAAQANKLGISKIDYCLVLDGKSNRTPTQELEADISGKVANSNVKETDVLDSRNSKLSGKPSSMHEIINDVHNSNVQKEDTSSQSNMFAVHKSTMDTCVSGNHVSHLGVSSNTKALNAQERIEKPNTNTNLPSSHKNTTCNIKEKQEPILQCFDDTANNSAAIVSPKTESNHRCSLKRISSNEDLQILLHSKKKPSGIHTSTNSNDEQWNVRYVDYKNIMSHNEYPIRMLPEFNHYNITTSQSMMTVESPNSDLHEIEVDYQQQLTEPAPPLVITNPDEEQFVDLQDLKDSALLSPSLDTNPELMMKIFDDLRPIMGLEKGLNDTKVQQLIPNNQAVNNEITRTYKQLANNMKLRESQFNMLERNLENPALGIQREHLSQLQAEHKMQKQMLKSLQQDHHNIQHNMKHNIGVTLLRNRKRTIDYFLNS